jgi:hypothetical protein
MRVIHLSGRHQLSHITNNMHNGLNLGGGVWRTKSPLVTENEAGANFGWRFLNRPLIRRARAQNYSRNETVLANSVGEIKLNEASRPRVHAIESGDLFMHEPAARFHLQ